MVPVAVIAAKAAVAAPAACIRTRGPLVSGANSSERLMFRLRLRLSEKQKPSPTVLRKVHVASPAAAVSVRPVNRVRISSLNLCQNEASFPLLVVVI